MKSIGAVTLHGPTAVLAGIVLLGLAYLNWRYVEAWTRLAWSERTASWLARHPLGNKIGGTIVLALFGLAMVVGGIVQTFWN